MSFFLINLLLAIAWAALVGSFEPINLLFGFLLGFIVMWIINRVAGTAPYFKRAPRIIEFFLFFVWELLTANFRLIATVLSPRMPLRPAVVAVPLDLKKENSLILLANLISLTPGTLSLDISNDRQTLFVHTIWLEDPDTFRQEIKQGFERRVKEILEP